MLRCSGRVKGIASRPIARGEPFWSSYAIVRMLFRGVRKFVLVSGPRAAFVIGDDDLD